MPGNLRRPRRTVAATLGMKRGRSVRNFRNQRKDYSIPDFVSWVSEVAEELRRSSNGNTNIPERFVRAVSCH